jgi:hypothetical protein
MVNPVKQRVTVEEMNGQVNTQMNKQTGNTNQLTLYFSSLCTSTGSTEWDYRLNIMRDCFCEINREEWVTETERSG